MSRNRASWHGQVRRRRGQLSSDSETETLALPRARSGPEQGVDAGKVTLVFLPQKPRRAVWCLPPRGAEKQCVLDLGALGRQLFYAGNASVAGRRGGRAASGSWLTWSLVGREQPTGGSSVKPWRGLADRLCSVLGQEGEMGNPEKDAEGGY